MCERADVDRDHREALAGRIELQAARRRRAFDDHGDRLAVQRRRDLVALRPIDQIVLLAFHRLEIPFDRDSIADTLGAALPQLEPEPGGVLDLET